MCHNPPLCCSLHCNTPAEDNRERKEGRGPWTLTLAPQVSIVAILGEASWAASVSWPKRKLTRKKGRGSTSVCGGKNTVYSGETWTNPQRGEPQLLYTH